MKISVQLFHVAHADWNARYFQRVAGGYELVFQANLNMRSEKHVYSAEIFGAKIKLLTGSGYPLDLGYSMLDVPLRVHCRSFLRQVEFKVRLLPHQLEEIEERRAGENVEFELEIHGNGYEGKSERLIDQDKWRLGIPQSEWIDLLYSVGAYSSIDISVKCPIATPDTGRQAIYRAFKAAHDQFKRGNYSNCVSGCRMVLDLLLKKNGIVVQETLNSLSSDRRKLSKYDREKLIVASVTHLTNLAHHTAEDQLPEFDRSEARFVLTTTAAAVQRFVRS